MATLTLDRVGKRFGEVGAVKDVSLEVQDGDFAVLLGPSGSGKSTLLRLVAGLEAPDSGAIRLDNRPLNDVAPKDRPVALMRQSYALYPHLSVRENLALWPRLRGLPPEEIERRIDRVAERIALRELLEHTPRQLRGGQRQRLALARCLIRQPEVYLLDEPLSNLDAKLRTQTRGELTKLLRWELKSTVLYATHDTVEALALASRVAVLRDGQVQQVGTPTEVYDHPATMFVAGFVGMPAINFWRGEVRADGDRLAVQAGSLQLILPPSLAAHARRHGRQRVIIGLRPHDMYLPGWAPSGADLQPARFAVDVVEQLGDSTALWMHDGDQYSVATMRPRADVRAGESVALLLDARHLHLFDPDSQAAVA